MPLNLYICFENFSLCQAFQLTFSLILNQYINFLLLDFLFINKHSIIIIISQELIHHYLHSHLHYQESLLHHHFLLLLRYHLYLELFHFNLQLLNNQDQMDHHKNDRNVHHQLMIFHTNSKKTFHFSIQVIHKS